MQVEEHRRRPRLPAEEPPLGEEQQSARPEESGNDPDGSEPREGAAGYVRRGQR